MMAAFASYAVPALAQAQAMAGWSDKQLVKRAESYAKLSPADFARTATVEDDDLEPVTTITTENGFRFKGGFTDTVRSDPFLRTLVDKKTGAVTYQLYIHLTYSGEDRRFALLNIGSADGPLSINSALDSHKVQCPYGACVWEDDVAFELPEALVRAIAEKASERPVQPWRFRLKSLAGQNFTDDIPPAEVAGLLLAIAGRRGRTAR